jgi:hypothetical protein
VSDPSLILLALFSTGQKTFALIFIVLFALGMIWAYRSDAKVNKLYYKNVWLVLISMIIILTSIVVLVKILH